MTKLDDMTEDVTPLTTDFMYKTNAAGTVERKVTIGNASAVNRQFILHNVTLDTPSASASEYYAVAGFASGAATFNARAGACPVDGDLIEYAMHVDNNSKTADASAEFSIDGTEISTAISIDFGVDGIYSETGLSDAVTKSNEIGMKHNPGSDTGNTERVKSYYMRFQE